MTELARLRARVAELEARELPVDEQIKAFKKQVTTVAKKYAKDYNWCEVVDRALDEMGVGRSFKPIQVEVQTTATMTVDVDVDEWAGMSADQREAFIRSNVSVAPTATISAKRDAPVRRIRNVSSGDLLIGTIGEPQPTTEATLAQIPAPNGYIAMFTSAEGRAAHYIRDGAGGSNSWREVTALCGATSYSHSWTARSPRDEGRTCQRCMDRAANR